MTRAGLLSVPDRPGDRCDARHRLRLGDRAIRGGRFLGGGIAGLRPNSVAAALPCVHSVEPVPVPGPLTPGKRRPKGVAKLHCSAHASADGDTCQE